MQERLELRTENSKTIHIDGNKYRLIASRKPIHYMDGDLWSDIDVNIKNGRVDKAAYESFILNDKFGYTITNKKTGKTIKIWVSNIGGIVPQYFEPIIEGNVAKWTEIIPGIDLKIIFYNHMVRIWRTIKNKSSKKSIEWNVEEDEMDDAMKFREFFPGYDSKGRKTLSTFEKKNISRVSGKLFYSISETFTGTIYDRNKKTRKKEISNDVEYPVVIDPTVDVLAIPADCGSAIILTSASAVTSTDFSISEDLGEIYNFSRNSGNGKALRSEFIRFVGITIPQGSTITSALLKIFPNTFTLRGTEITFKARDLNDPSNPTSWQQVISPGTLALATKQTTLPITTSLPSSYLSFDVSSIVQELVNSFDYSNESMLFFISKATLQTGTDNQRFRHYLAGALGTTKDPELVIDYTAGGGGYAHKVNKISTPTKVHGVTPSKVQGI